MPEKSPANFIELARQRLRTEWQTVMQLPPDAEPQRPVLQNIAEALGRSVNSRTKTYRYVLPTQLLAKAVDTELDARCVQVGSALAKPFDARSLCHEVIVEFDRANSNVLGGSAEPYLNNPLRIPAIIPAHRHAQKDKKGFDDLMLVLDYVQTAPGMAGVLLRTLMLAIRGRLSTVAVVYPVPNRVSLKQTAAIVYRFLATRSGGLRLQTVAVALFRCIGERFKLFDTVRSNSINAADVSTGSAADLECLDKMGAIVLAVEVKDRQLKLHDIQDKLPAIREKGIREIPFLVQHGVQDNEAKAASDLIDRQFVTGQNIYVVEFDAFLDSCLMLFGETGRREFMRKVGEELDTRQVDISHRRNWAELLATV